MLRRTNEFLQNKMYTVSIGAAVGRKNYVTYSNKMLRSTISHQSHVKQIKYFPLRVDTKVYQRFETRDY